MTALCDTLLKAFDRSKNIVRVTFFSLNALYVSCSNKIKLAVVLLPSLNLHWLSGSNDDVQTAANLNYE